MVDDLPAGVRRSGICDRSRLDGTRLRTRDWNCRCDCTRNRRDSMRNNGRGPSNTILVRHSEFLDTRPRARMNTWRREGERSVARRPESYNTAIGSRISIECVMRRCQGHVPAITWESGQFRRFEPLVGSCIRIVWVVGLRRLAGNIK